MTEMNLNLDLEGLAVTNLLTGKRLELYNKGLDLQFDVITTYR